MSQSSVDEIIRQAMEDGKFDNLAGEGKPLDLEQYPHQDPEWRVAYHLLKSGGFSLPWIERLGEINDKLQQARLAIQRSWSWQQNLQGGSDKKVDWNESIALFRDRINSINDQIRTYNLEVPNTYFQVPLVDSNLELENVMKAKDC